MEARYLTNESGELIGVVVDPESYRAMRGALESYEENREFLEQSLLQAHAAVTLATEALHKSPEKTQRLGYRALLTTQRAALEELTASLEKVLSGLEDLEDLEASAALTRDVAEIERGEAELIPWEQSKSGRRGEL